MTHSPQPSIEDIREQLAAIEHERWSDWQKWMHSKGVWIRPVDQDYLTISKGYITHLESQIDTPYDLLTPGEQASDMEQVDRYWPIITQLIARERKAELQHAIDTLRSFVRGTSKLPASDALLELEDRLAALNSSEEVTT